MILKLKLLLSIFILSLSTIAAPPYEGIGCDKDGEYCILGKPTGRVLKWIKIGTIAELGSLCENFINQIENRKNEILKDHLVDLKYKNFSYRWHHELDSNGHAKIVCSVQLNSEIETVKFETNNVQSFNWVCKDNDSDGICLHHENECQQALEKQLSKPEILDAAIYRGASLFQGSICTITTVKFLFQK
ncbi:MAG: hypothetical protein KDD45_07100 [Bdellovibrionales bacterium]|nr:hypothetical protein [Bdellovibrionales bacterium]